jgi:alpha-tubulin suppressor-like RCC1 family protein
MQLDNASSTIMLPGNAVSLLLIDSRITANELIVQAMNDNTQCIIFDYSVDTIETLKAKISEHPSPEFSSVGIVQHNYSTPIYQLLHSMQSSVLENVETMDVSLESWSELKDFVAFLKDSKKTQYYDLLACNIYSDPNWKYVLTLLDSQCAIHFRASSDTTGWGGNWILESDNVDLTQLYFTDKIADYPFNFSSNTGHTGIIINGNPYTCGYNNRGQLGHGTAGTNVSTMTQMVRPTNISSDATYVALQISTGYDCTYVLYSNGTDYKLYSCGSNEEGGKLGQGGGSDTSAHPRLLPVSLSMFDASYKTGLVNITISTSLWVMFVVLNYASDFKMYGCGRNLYHGLGTGSNVDYPSLTLVPRTNIPTGTYIKCLSPGGLHTCVLMSNNKVYASGYNAQGQSQGTNTFAEYTAVNIAGKTIKSIAAGDLHNLLLYTDNTIYGIGYSDYGQCSVYQTVSGIRQLVSTTPSALTGYTPISISCGAHHNIVMYSNGTTNIPYTNGINFFGGLGRNPETAGGTTAINSKANLDPMVLTGITLSPSIAIGTAQTSIVVFKGTDNNVNKVYMCGYNPNGMFGNGVTATNNTALTPCTTINSLLTTCSIASPPSSDPNNYNMVFTTTAVAAPALTPDAPTGLSATAGNGQVTITFTDGSANGSAITNYQYSADGSSNWTAVSSTTPTITSPAVITGLNNGTSYTYYLRAINANGNGATSLTSVTATPRTTPAAPTGLSATAGNGQATITFTAGAANGSAITNYQYSTDGSTNWTAVSSTTATITSPAVITGLTYQTYTIYLRAVNGAGNGAASATSVTTTPYLVPDAPTMNSVVLGDQSATINFTAGAENGRAITNYQYTCSSTGTDNWTTLDPASTTSPIIVSNLTNGATYSVKLKAISSAGSSAASAPQSVTPATTPAAPTITSVTAGNLKATINITANATNGSAITNYKYTCSSTGEDNWITLSPESASTTIVVTGLSNETLYSVKVIAVNGVGDSVASSASSVTPSISAPDAPTITGITAGNGTASIAFTTNSDNGIAITNYKYSTDGGSKWTMRDPISVATPLLLSNLVNGSACSIQIKAINEKGSSVASNTISATPASTPDAPTINSITAGNGTASVVFIDNATNGSLITGYKYSIDSAAWVAVAATNPIALSELTNSQTYSIRILAVNAMGDGSVSTAMSVTPAAAPAAPSVSSVTAGNDSLSINLSSGASNGSAIKNYKYSIDNGTSWTTRTPASVESPLSVTSKISNGSSYNVILKAINDKGVSSVSNTQAVTAAVAPAAPTITSIRAGDQSASIYYIAGAANGSAITSYQYSTDNGANWASSTASPIVVSSLSNNQTYSVKLIAVNAKGSSLSSAVVQVTPAKAPAAPTITSVTGSGSSIIINFTEGATNGSPIINYKYSTNGGVKWTLRTSVSAESPIVVSRLATGSTYSVQIKAINAKGVSVASNAVSVTL